MTKKLTTITMFSVLMVIGGYILYVLSNLLPIPGSKFITMGPYLTFVMIMPLIRYPRFGTISLINLVFGGLMLIFSPWMTLAIILSGIAADLVMLLPLWMKLKQILSMGVYNGVSLITSVYITTFITGNVMYQILNNYLLIGVFIIAFVTGALGGYAGLKVNHKFLKDK